MKIQIGEILFDEKCWGCKGPGSEPACWCRGTGYALTDAGEELVEFFRRHRSRIFEDES